VASVLIIFNSMFLSGLRAKIKWQLKSSFLDEKVGQANLLGSHSGNIAQIRGISTLRILSVKCCIDVSSYLRW
jgi:hypothetical protein